MNLSNWKTLKERQHAIMLHLTESGVSPENAQLLADHIESHSPNLNTATFWEWMYKRFSPQLDDIKQEILKLTQ